MLGDDTPTRRPDSDDHLTRRGIAPGIKVFGRYVLEAEAGRGGMGVVWRAHDEELDRVVALKFLPEAIALDPEALRDLKQETRRCLELTHPNIVRVHDLVRGDGWAAISMEFVEGQSLARRKAGSAKGCLSAGELAPWVAQLCAALDYAHEQAKVVHRDLKPANILLTTEGMVKITDFGIARSLTETHTRLTGRAGDSSGTLVYMSPQQLRGLKPGAADDIYALGATLYDLLTGKPPFFRGAIATQVAEDAPVALQERREELGTGGAPVPPAWEQTILACLAKQPQDRPQTAGEVARLLGVTSGSLSGSAGSNVGPGLGPPAAGFAAGRVSGQSGLRREPAASADSGRQEADDAATRRVVRSPAGGRERRRVVFPAVGRWLALAAAAVILLALGAWWYYGSRGPSQPRPTEATPAPKEQRPAAERAKSGEDDLARGRLAAEQAQRKALGWVDALPLTASDTDLAAVAAKIELYSETATPERAEEVRAAFAKRRDDIVAERERVRQADAHRLQTAAKIAQVESQLSETRRGAEAAKATAARALEAKKRLATQPVVVPSESPAQTAARHEAVRAQVDESLARAFSREHPFAPRGMAPTSATRPAAYAQAIRRSDSQAAAEARANANAEAKARIQAADRAQAEAQAQVAAFNARITALEGERARLQESEGGIQPPAQEGTGAVALSHSPVASGPYVPNQDRFVLESISTRIHASGVVKSNGQSFLLFRERKLKVGDTLTIGFGTADYTLVISEIQPTFFKVRLNREEIAIPIGQGGVVPTR